jgi:hypothetical protein
MTQRPSTLLACEGQKKRNLHLLAAAGAGIVAVVLCGLQRALQASLVPMIRTALAI